MKLGWLWLSILKTAARPSPMSTTPAFSPGPWITQGACVGSFVSQILDDLYEQCSDHMTLKMPSSVTLGVRHQAEHPQVGAVDAGDVARTAVVVGLRGDAAVRRRVAERHQAVALQPIERGIIGVVVAVAVRHRCAKGLAALVTAGERGIS